MNKVPAPQEAFSKCGALQAQQCMYSAQGTMFCQGGQGQQAPPHFDNKINISFGSPFYEGNYEPGITVQPSDFKK